MPAKLTENCIDHLFSGNNPFFSKDGKRFVNYDSIKIENIGKFKSGIRVEFCFDKNPVAYIESHGISFSKGQSLIIDGITGSMEVHFE